MWNMATSSVTAAVVIFAASSAAAGDGLYRYDWSGAYVGANIGGTWGDSDLTENLPPFLALIPGAPTSFNDSFGVSGWQGGVQVGVNKQFTNHLVIGGELRLNSADVSGSTDDCAGSATLTGGILNVNCSTDLTWMVLGLGRIGWADDHWMVYGTGGVALAGLEHDVRVDLVGTPILANSQSDVAHGWALGVGGDYAITSAVSVGLEYLHTDLQSHGDGLLLGGVLTTGDRDMETDSINGHINVKVGG